jgi:hypothetical protein
MEGYIAIRFTPQMMQRAMPERKCTGQHSRNSRLPITPTHTETNAPPTPVKRSLACPVLRRQAPIEGIRTNSDEICSLQAGSRLRRTSMPGFHRLCRWIRVTMFVHAREV